MDLVQRTSLVIGSMFLLFITIVIRSMVSRPFIGRNLSLDPTTRFLKDLVVTLHIGTMMCLMLFPFGFWQLLYLLIDTLLESVYEIL